jgi:hypothetical protein
VDATIRAFIDGIVGPGPGRLEPLDHTAGERITGGTRRRSPVKVLRVFRLKWAAAIQRFHGLRTQDLRIRGP